jgi:serine/threonine protein phosphatase 1
MITSDHCGGATHAAGLGLATLVGGFSGTGRSIEGIVETVDLNPKHFALLRPGARIWAVAAVRGEAASLRAVHAQIARLFCPGDRVVYLGDVIGDGADIRGTVDEVLRFRRLVLSTPPFTHPGDVVVLRGSQEEMWRNLLQIQFAAAAADVLQWMADRGVAKIVEAYGGNFAEGLAAARSGAMVLGQWTSRLRSAVRAAPGHGAFMTMMMHAAVTTDGALLLINSGLDPKRSLAEQGDRFWWDTGGPNRMTERYSEAGLVVRGADPARGGVHHEVFRLALDSGCGEGGPLNAVCLSGQGEVLETVTA